MTHDTRHYSYGLQGSYEYVRLCRHGPGITNDGGDINECALHKDICGQEGTCENLHGSYRCICNPGYQVRRQSN